jgi:Uncharacterised nucleotidyltransferase
MEISSAVGSRALLVGGNLAVDAVTSEVVAALEKERVGAILLRGPAIARWLYDEEAGPVRAYDDVDLLIGPRDIERGQRVLGGLGFVNRFAAFAPGESVEHSSEWWRAGTVAAVDLHRTLLGVGVDPSELWRELASNSDRLAVARYEVQVPSKPGRVLIVALHAAHHGIGETKPLRDLAAAIEREDPSLWADVARVAERLSATPAFAAGLQLLPEGARIANQLGIAAAVDTDAALLAGSPAPTAYGFARLAATPGLRGKLAFLARKLVPTPAFMRYAFSVARRGRMGLALAYLWRPVWLLLHAGPGLVAWLRARR